MECKVALLDRKEYLLSLGCLTISLVMTVLGYAFEEEQLLFGIVLVSMGTLVPCVLMMLSAIMHRNWRAIVTLTLFFLLGMTLFNAAVSDGFKMKWMAEMMGNFEAYYTAYTALYVTIFANIMAISGFIMDVIQHGKQVLCGRQESVNE